MATAQLLPSQRETWTHAWRQRFRITIYNRDERESSRIMSDATPPKAHRQRDRMNTITIIYEKGDIGYWVASIAEVPGAISQGKTRDEARVNVLDALRELMAANRDLALSERSAGAETESVKIPA